MANNVENHPDISHDYHATSTPYHNTHSFFPFPSNPFVPPPFPTDAPRGFPTPIAGFGPGQLHYQDPQLYGNDVLLATKPEDDADNLKEEEKQLFSGNTSYFLDVRQNPTVGKTTSGKEKDRKPLDPPPIVELVMDPRLDPQQNYFNSPYFFLSCSLVKPDVDQSNIETGYAGNVLLGTLASSLYRLRDETNKEGAFFIFGDLASKSEGDFRLLFTLYELKGTDYIRLSRVHSPVFTVHPGRTFPGMAESTPLTRYFCDQGVRLRLRKESRALMIRKRNSAQTEQLINKRQEELSRLERHHEQIQQQRHQQQQQQQQESQLQSGHHHHFDSVAKPQDEEDYMHNSSKSSHRKKQLQRHRQQQSEDDDETDRDSLSRSQQFQQYTFQGEERPSTRQRINYTQSTPPHPPPPPPPSHAPHHAPHHHAPHLPLPQSAGLMPPITLYTGTTPTSPHTPISYQGPLPPLTSHMLSSPTAFSYYQSAPPSATYPPANLASWPGPFGAATPAAAGGAADDSTIRGVGDDAAAHSSSSNSGGGYVPNHHHHHHHHHSPHDSPSAAVAAAAMHHHQWSAPTYIGDDADRGGGNWDYLHRNGH